MTLHGKSVWVTSARDRANLAKSLNSSAVAIHNVRHEEADISNGFSIRVKHTTAKDGE